MKLCWVAGWGTDARVFERVTPLLSEFEHHTISLWDTEPPSALLPEGCIGIGHSMGGWWLAERCSALKGLIYLGGFKRFPANARTMTLMQKKFALTPQIVLLDFYAGCHAEDYAGIAVGAHNKAALEAALARLSAETVAAPPLPHAAIHGHQDKIVPLYHAAHEFKDITVIPDAGHLPQWTHPEAAARALKKIIQQWQL